MAQEGAQGKGKGKEGGKGSQTEEEEEEGRGGGSGGGERRDSRLRQKLRVEEEKLKRHDIHPLRLFLFPFIAITRVLVTGKLPCRTFFTIARLC